MPKITLPKFSWLRLIRLVLGISFIGEAIANRQWLFLFLGGFLIYQAIMNVGCTSCDTGACEVPEESSTLDRDVENL